MEDYCCFYTYITGSTLCSPCYCVCVGVSSTTSSRDTAGLQAFFQFCVYGKSRPVTQEVPAANWSHMTLIKQLCCNTRSIWLCKLLHSFR